MRECQFAKNSDNSYFLFMFEGGEKIFVDTDQRWYNSFDIDYNELGQEGEFLSYYDEHDTVPEFVKELIEWAKNETSPHKLVGGGPIRTE